MTDLVRFNWPYRELVEQARLLGGAREKRFRENVKKRRLQSLSQHFVRNGLHEQVQQLEVLLCAVLKGASIAQTNVNCDVETA